MGKKQHQKDKLYITNKEWKEEWGGKKEDLKERAKFRRLPYNYCTLSMQPFEHPLCTKEGVVFDLLNIVPFLKRYGKNPATGEPLAHKDLIKLNFHKNSNGQYHCPVMYKIFTQNSHIVAIKTTGNVFSYDAIEELNLKSKNMNDLLNNEPFKRKDIITIQDPNNLDKFNISNFYHIKNNVKLVDEEEEQAKKNPMYRIRKTNVETENTLKELHKTYKEPTESYLKPKEKQEISSRFDAHYSTGKMAGSFTSTSQDRTNVQEAASLGEDTIRYRRVQKLGKKGYVRMSTSLGDLNLELHCEMVPRTCDNFIKLCATDFYKNTTFHRLIKNFMVQGGDPTGTGKGGDSIWGKPFKDEFKPNLSHSGRGILSMANSGKDTNKSQFFITFRSCQHLDNKHSVFGKVVGGLDTLTAIERIEVDEHDRPTEEITLTNMTIFVNPFEEIDEQLQKEKEEEDRKAEEEKQLQKERRVAKVEAKKKVYRPNAVGKYIPTNISKRPVEGSPLAAPSSSKKIKSSGGFGDFSTW